MRRRIIIFVLVFLSVTGAAGYASGLELTVKNDDALTITVLQPPDKEKDTEAAEVYTYQNSGEIIIEVEPEAQEEAAVFQPENEIQPESGDISAESEAAEPAPATPAEPESPGQKISTILLYHTHTKEAYAQTAEELYAECGAYRTADPEHNISAVGEVIRQKLAENGFAVLHNTVDNEAEVFSQSYGRSLSAMQQETQQNPDINVYIDIHRDSIDDKEYAQQDIVTADGTEYARVLFVVGKGENFEGEEKPNWESNLALAEQVSARLNEIIPGISKGVMVKTGRYNQHLSDRSMLIEVGYDANTLAQAKNTAGIVGTALSDILE